VANDYTWKVEKSSKVKLKDYDPDFTHGETTRQEADLELQNLGEEISKLQELLAAAQHHFARWSSSTTASLSTPFICS